MANLTLKTLPLSLMLLFQKYFRFSHIVLLDKPFVTTLCQGNKLPHQRAPAILPVRNIYLWGLGEGWRQPGQSTCQRNLISGGSSRSLQQWLSAQEQLEVFFESHVLLFLQILARWGNVVFEVLVDDCIY